MDCKLKACAGWNAMREIVDPSPEAIEQAIDELIPVLHHFVILEHEEPINHCPFIQTLITHDPTPDMQYLIETRFEYENSFRQYKRYTNDASELKRLFRMFALGIVPDIDGWTDITAELIAEDKEREAYG